MRSTLFGENVESTSTDYFSLQNSKMLRVALNGEVMARQGAMVAYQGQMDFDYQGSGGIGRFIKKALTGEGLPLMSGGLFNTLLTGTGWVAITAHGAPVVLGTDQPTFADAQAAIAWSSGLQTRIHASVKLGSLLGRSSGESIQMAFAGQGFVIVQASEGPTVPPHSHGENSGGGGLFS